MPPDRASRACLQCRKVKRKCNGLHPCRNCSTANRECTYSGSSSKKLASNEDSLVDNNELQEDPITRIRNEADTSSALNSGDLLVRRLGISPDFSSGGSRLCSWNFRLHKDSSYLGVAKPFSEILTTEHMRRLAEIYFAEIHPVYKFLDPETIYRSISVSSSQPPQHPSYCVLLGIAALACLFSQEDPDTETEIIHHARLFLEHSTVLEVPTIDHVVGWLLRVIYLRFTSSPNTTWLASCTLMHMIETSQLSNEPAPAHNFLDQTSQESTPYTPQLKSQIYYTAQIFNSWISYDHGKPRIIPHGASYTTPSAGWTPEDRIFWKLSESLDPTIQPNSAELEKMLKQTIQLQPSHPAMNLKRCNIALCIYRRLRISGQVISTKTVQNVLDVADDGLRIATTMARARSPWWHILNVPFQILCVLLAMDNPASLSRVGKSFQVLKLLAKEYGVESIRETWMSACALLRHKIQRKREDFEMLDRIEIDILTFYNSDTDQSHLLDTSLLNEDQDQGQGQGQGQDDLGEFWELNEYFSANLFTL